MYLKLKKRKRRKMIHLNNSATSEFAVTLYEKTTLPTPFYLFHFKNDTLNGSLILGKSGYYEYYIYEQTSATNLDPTLSTGLVEQGKMRLFNVADNPNFTEHNVAGVTNYVYNPS
mgnify:CR=1 FL=1